MPPRAEDDVSSLEKARAQLYAPGAARDLARGPLSGSGEHTLPHAWRGESAEVPPVPPPGKKHVRVAGLFLGVSVAFFLAALSLAAYFFYFGGNSVSVNKIDIVVQGPTVIAGGDTVPLSLSITNRNPVALQDAVLDITFPEGTRTPGDTQSPLPRYRENLGTVLSGETITRSIKAVVFGGAGDTLVLPIELSYATSGANAGFVKKGAYELSISSSPLSVSVEAQQEAVAGKPITFTLTVRSNAPTTLDNVILSGAFPFGFSPLSSSLELTGSSFLLGRIAPGASKTISLTGLLEGQAGEERVFRFSVGTADTSADQTLSVAYMTQSVSIALAPPFIETSIAVNGDTGGSPTLRPGATQSVRVTYTNTLDSSITNAVIEVALTGAAADYDSVETSSGFYRSSDRTIVFSRDTEPALASLSPGASGSGFFTFETLPASSGVRSPEVSFVVSITGSRVGQTGVPEQVSSSARKSAKVVTSVALTSEVRYSSGPFANTGPIPPRANENTSYSIIWSARNEGSAVAGGSVSATLPSFVAYSGVTSGQGSFTYDPAARTVTWSVGDIAQGGNAQGAFQVVLTPSSAQRGTAPALVAQASFSAFDRFAGVDVSATAGPATTETKGDPGYSSAKGIVQ